MRGITPQIFCSINGRNVSSVIFPRLIEATVTDGTGIESDGLTVVLDNADDLIDRPRKKDTVIFGGGYRETGGPKMFGSYSIEDVEKTAFPRRLVIVARAGAPGDKIKERKNRAFEDKTIGEIVKQVAGDAGLTPAIDPDLEGIKIPYRAQLNESDMHLLTAIGQRLGAIATMKDGHLVFARKGKGMTASGIVMPLVLVGLDDLTGEDAMRLRGCARARYGTIRAHWHDPKTATRKKVEKSGDGAILEIPELFQSEDEAKAAVDGKRNNLDREEEKLSLKIVGRETVQAEANLIVAGVDRDADGQWSIDMVTHSFSGTEIYTTEIEAVRKGSD